MNLNKIVLIFFLTIYINSSFCLCTNAISEETTNKTATNTMENGSNINKIDDKYNNIKKIIYQNLDPSYLSLGGGVNFNFWRNNHFDFRDIYFEGELNNHFHLFKNLDNQIPILKNKVSFLETKNIYVIVNPKIQLRMYNESSTPVKTPGFLPRLTLYCFDKKDVPNSNEPFNYWSLMLSHHSNGQNGEFFNTDGTVNTDNGNFSTNFIELAFNTVNRKFLPEWSKFAIICHPDFNREDGLKDQYEKIKAEISFHIADYRNIQNITKSLDWFNTCYHYKILGSISYTLAGRNYVVAPNNRYPEIAPQRAEWDDNLNLSISFYLRPQKFNDIYWFAKYDVGYDYYNINFQKEINRFQIGIAGDPFGLF